MKNNIEIEEITLQPAMVADTISYPIFFLDEENGMYRATAKCYQLDVFVGNVEAVFTQSEYDAWGTDNEYIYDLLLQKLSMKRIIK